MQLVGFKNGCSTLCACNAKQCTYCCLQLLTTAMNQASELFKSAEEGDLVASLRQCAASGAAEKVRELSIKLDEHSEHIQEVSKWNYLYK
jgi:hypothetical protein